MPRPVRVLVADDHDVVVEGIQSILREAPDMEVVGPPIRSGEALIETVQKIRPDVLLLDAKMPAFDMPSTLERLAMAMPMLRIIVVTAHQDPQLVKLASDKGAAGYILKEEALSSLLPLAVRDVATGSFWFSPRASRYLLQASAPKYDLSEYQRDVLRLMVTGQPPEGVAAALKRSISAIYSAQSQIREKLGVETNEQAIVTAIRDRIVPLGLDGPSGTS